MNLTPNDKRDIVKLIEEGKPLPDKYRFLLFDDKREVELVWNGKTNEVCNVVLPFQVIEQVDEPRAEKPEDAAQQTDLFTTDARGRQLKGWSNKLIWGDNKLIVRVGKDKNGKITREPLTKHWTDWIDYWAVDFDFESKREIIRVRNEDTGETEEQWSGDYIFENEWQSFRTKKDRSLGLTSMAHECTPGRRKIAVKVVDIFGNDTMKLLDVGI